MPAAGVSLSVAGFDCEAASCNAHLTLETPDLVDLSDMTNPTDQLRWYAPQSPEFYEAGWVFKMGHAHALTYCQRHGRRSLRCTCYRRRGVITRIKESCARHSNIADIRINAEDMHFTVPTRVEIFGPPRVWSKYDFERMHGKFEYRSFNFRGNRWTFNAERIPYTTTVRVSWQSTSLADTQ